MVCDVKQCDLLNLILHVLMVCLAIVTGRCGGL